MNNHTIYRNTPIPLYQQIKTMILEDIATGKLPPHYRLPSERELGQNLNVSRIVVRQALSELVHHGHLYTTPSRGYFVSEIEQSFQLNNLLSFSTIAQERGMTPGTRMIEAKIIPATEVLAQQLFVPVGSEVVFISRLRFLNENPVLIANSWLAHSLCPDILKSNIASGSLFQILKSQYNILMTRSYTIVSARVSTDNESTLLNLDSPGVVLTMGYRNFTDENKPVEMAELSIHPQRFPLSFEHTEKRSSLSLYRT